jgi:four helix bundle protein
MPGARRVENLLVWKLADQVRRRVRALISGPEWRNHERLRRQLDTAAEAACPNIKEGFDRYHPVEFARFLRIAKGTLGETTEHLDAAVAKGLATPREAAEITSLCNRGRAAAIRLILYLESAEAPNVPRTQPKQRRKAEPIVDPRTPRDEPPLWTDERKDDPRWQ